MLGQGAFMSPLGLPCVPFGQPGGSIASVLLPLAASELARLFLGRVRAHLFHQRVWRS